VYQNEWGDIMSMRWWEDLCDYMRMVRYGHPETEEAFSGICDERRVRKIAEMLAQERELSRRKGVEYCFSNEDRERQRRSFAYGNVHLSNDSVTREDIDAVASRIGMDVDTSEDISKDDA